VALLKLMVDKLKLQLAPTALANNRQLPANS
jgi:hypothetical protein